MQIVHKLRGNKTLDSKLKIGRGQSGDKSINIIKIYTIYIHIYDIYAWVRFMAAAAAERTLWFTVLMTRRAGKPETPDCFGFSSPDCERALSLPVLAEMQHNDAQLLCFRHHDTCQRAVNEEASRQSGGREGIWGRGSGSGSTASDWFAATATAFKLSCKQHAAILPLLAVAGLFHSFTRPASCSTSFPTASSSPFSSSASPSTLDQCDNNATSAVAFASARQTRCASRPAGTLQSAYPATHTHTLTVCESVPVLHMQMC